MLQLSKIVITLPSMLLGSRWSKGHYTIMNDSMLNNHFIANNLNDHMHEAVALDTNIEVGWIWKVELIRIFIDYLML